MKGVKVLKVLAISTCTLLVGAVLAPDSAESARENFQCACIFDEEGNLIPICMKVLEQECLLDSDCSPNMCD